MKRVIKITEFLQKIFTVEAETEIDALNIVDNEYRRKGSIVLEADDFAGNEVEDVTDEYSCERIELLPKIDDITNQTTR